MRTHLKPTRFSIKVGHLAEVTFFRQVMEENQGFQSEVSLPDRQKKLGSWCMCDVVIILKTSKNWLLRLQTSGFITADKHENNGIHYQILLGHVI